jgi:hypothetical protein
MVSFLLFKVIDGQFPAFQSKLVLETVESCSPPLSYFETASSVVPVAA